MSAEFHQLLVVLVSGTLFDDEPVDDGPDAKAAEGEQFAYACADVADVEPVDAHATEKDGNDEGSGGYFSLALVF